MRLRFLQGQGGQFDFGCDILRLREMKFRAPNRAENCGSEDLQGGGVFSVVVGFYDDLHVLIEGDEEAQKALHGELAEVAAEHLSETLTRP